MQNTLCGASPITSLHLIFSYNRQHIQQIQQDYDTHALPQQLVVCPETEVDANNYLHPSTGQVVAFDHTTGEAGAARPATAEENPSKLKEKRFMRGAYSQRNWTCHCKPIFSWHTYGRKILPSFPTTGQPCRQL